MHPLSLLCEPAVASREENTVILVNRPCLVTPGARRLAAERDIILGWNTPENPSRTSTSILSDTLAGRIDSTLLAASATPDEVAQFARVAASLDVAACCVNPVYVPIVAQELRGTLVAVCTVVGFPLGASATAIKVAETLLAVEQGATEIDLVMSLGRAKAGDWETVGREIREVRAAAPRPAVELKVIIEAPLLTDLEIDRASRIAADSGADYVKTGTGTAGPVEPRHVTAIAHAVGARTHIKAAGGIRDLTKAMALLDLGALRLGTSTPCALLEEALEFAS